MYNCILSWIVLVGAAIIAVLGPLLLHQQGTEADTKQNTTMQRKKG